jgi:hypothetical protein
MKRIIPAAKARAVVKARRIRRFEERACCELLCGERIRQFAEFGPKCIKLLAFSLDSAKTGNYMPAQLALAHSGC